MILEINLSYSESKDIADYICENISIIDIIESYGLKYIVESENRFRMLCPFHQEKTPSLKIFKETNSFHCFGCGEGSSVIDFIMLYEKVSFSDVVNRYKTNANVGSTEHLIKKLNDKFFGSNYNLEKDLIYKKYHLGIELREFLKLNPDKISFVDERFYELDRDFNVDSDLNQEKLEYLYDEMLMRIKNGE